MNAKVKKGLCIGLAIIAGVLLIYFISNRIFGLQSNFTGTRLRNPDNYELVFSMMNQNDTHSMQLTEGQVLHVNAEINRGTLALIIQKEGSDPIYRSDDLETGNFDLTVSEAGTYTISVKAKKAKGSLRIYFN